MCSCGGERPADSGSSTTPPAAVGDCGGGPALLSELAETRPAYDELPEQLSINDETCKKMQELMDKSIDGDRISQEHAGTLVIRDATGELEMANETSGDAGSAQPSDEAPEGTTYQGIFHTHPYGKNDGADLDGTTASFSGQDFAVMDDYDANVSVVQSNDTKYVMVRTDETPSKINDAEANKFYEKEQAKVYHAAIAEGKSPKEAMQISTEAAAKKTAEKYKFGYYEGTDCSNLSRVSP